MQTKQVIFDKEARDKLIAGAEKLAKAVTSTLGPRSRNVAINLPYPAPRVIHDGVSVAKAIKLKDPFEDMGAALLREASSKTGDLAGDGTTTATLLAITLLKEGMKLIEGGMSQGKILPRVNPMELKEELFKYSKIIEERIEKMAKKVKTKKDIERIATISASSEEIGKIVSEAIHKMGDNGIIIAERGESFETTIEYSEGIEFDNGYLSPAFVTDAHRMIAEYQESYVLLTDYIISDPAVIKNIVENVVREGQGKALIIVADNVVGNALVELALLKVRSQIPIVCVMAPEFAERRKEMLEDLAILTGGNVITKDTAQSLENMSMRDLGKARHIRVTQTHTMIAPLNTDQEELNARAEAIREQIKNAPTDFAKERLQNRLAKFTQGVAIIKAGGATSTEIDEKNERIIDAVHAAKAALRGGIVPGGGVALRNIAREINEDTDDPVLSAVVSTLLKPASKLLENAGEGEIISQTLFSDKKDNEGYDVVSKKFVDMYEAGIVDPAEVTRLAVKHAFSVAALILTTDTLITEEPDDNVQKIKVMNQ